MKLFMFIFIPTFVVLSMIDTQPKEQPVNNYSAFEEITPEQLMAEKMKFEEELKRKDALIRNTK